MSRHRGGGRRSDPRPEQQYPSPSFQRGGGAGRGRGTGGRSGGYSGQRPSGPAPSQPVPAPGHPSPAAYRPGPSTPRPGPSAPRPVASQPASASSSAAASSLSRDVAEKLTLHSAAPVQPPVQAPVQVAPSSSKALVSPKRPGFGTLGQKCVVRANHFLVDIADRDLHQYDVTITPEITSKTVSREIIRQLVHMYRDSHLGARRPAYDGRKSIYTAGPLPFVSKDFVVKLADKNNSARKEREFRVAIKFASKADIHHLKQFLSSRQHDIPQETIQVLDVVLRESPSNKHTVVGRSFFSTELGQKGELGNGLEFWRGYYQSLRPTQMGLSLNIDVSARSFYEPIAIIEFLEKYLNLRGLSRPLTDQDRLKVKKALRGIRVEVSHRDTRRSYKITGVTTQPTSHVMFSVDDGTQISVAEYFRQKYNRVLKYAFLPAFQAGNDKSPIYLPMEVCTIVKGQRYTKKLNERQVTSLLRATCQRPRDREESIKQMARRNDFSGDELVSNEFGMQVGNDLTMVDARVLPSPVIKYHDTGRERTERPRAGAWNMINKKLVNGGTVDYWTCVNFSQRVRRDLTDQFCYELIDMCSSKGINFNPDPVIPVRGAHPGQIEKALRDIHRECTQKLGQQPDRQLQLLIIILPDVRGSYGKIKTVCETELGIVSQCCQPSQVQKLSKQYYENISLKINVKVGGRNNVLADAISRKIPLVSDRPTIIFGADVTHPPPGEDSNPSIAAVVASVDWPEVTKYKGHLRTQHHRQEMIADLYTETVDAKGNMVVGGMIRDSLIAYRRSTGLIPSRIIFYRDGVSEGQFSHVLLYEMDAIRKACASLQEGYLPPVTFIVVQKRHHTRLFPANHNDRNMTDKSGNILPGTVIDTKICHPTEFDFYLNSHAGIQGTSRPAHYHVLYDENNFNADLMQMLTNSLCYTYARCTRSVSLVPPAYYAHLAASRARYYMEGNESDGESGTGGGNQTRERDTAVRPLPAIKENVREVMFYC